MSRHIHNTATAFHILQGFKLKMKFGTCMIFQNELIFPLKKDTDVR